MLRRILGLGLVAITVITMSGLAVQPVHAGASGSFSTMTFPGCDIQFSGGTVDISAGKLHVRITSGTKVLRDDTRDIGNQSAITSFTIGFVDFGKPPRTSISVHVDVDGAVIGDFSGDYPAPCLNLDLTNFPSYLRDGRADPKPGDRMAIWCNKDKRNIDVWGVGNDSIGYPLTTFTEKELIAAGPDGVKHNVQNMGAVYAAMDNQGNLWIAWNGGPFGANGRDSFGKALNCKFAKA